MTPSYCGRSRQSRPESYRAESRSGGVTPNLRRAQPRSKVDQGRINPRWFSDGAPKQSSFRKGAVAGAIIGLIGGFIFASMMSDFDGDGGGGCEPGIVLIGVAGGSLAGAVLYAPFSDWRPIYRR